MRVVLITGDQLRHQWVAWQLAKEGWALSVFCDAARPNTPAQTVIEARLLEPPFHSPRLPNAWPGHPDVVLFYGCRLIDVKQFQCPVINLHLGLSPYYRGSATNLWALYDGKPECVGATIHLATNQVDAGPILAQVRPELAPTDGMHEVGIKALMAAVRIWPAVIRQHLKGPLQGQPQDITVGKLCKRKDYTPKAASQTEARLGAGLLPAYLADKARRDAVYPIREVQV